MLFLAEYILNSADTRIDCEDVGIQAMRYYYDLYPSSWVFILMWIPVAIATANIDYLISRIWSKGLPTWRPINGISYIVITLWALFTFVSLISLTQFGRAPISFVFKFVHVFFELINLMIFFLYWGWTSHATLTLVLSFVGVASSVSMPCEVTYPLTGIGAVLDSVNFFIVFYQYMKHFYDLPLMLATIAFFFHGTYIWGFLLMSYAVEDEYSKMLFRVYGVFANCMSVHFAVSAIDATFTGMTITEWVQTPYCDCIGRQASSQRFCTV